MGVWSDQARYPGPGVVSRRGVRAWCPGLVSGLGVRAWRRRRRGGRVSERRKIRVAIVLGGRGPEHAVSCMGGGNMLASIDRDKYDVVPVGITRDGNWVLAADDPERLAVTGGELPSVEAVAQPGSQIAAWASHAAIEATVPGQIPHLLSETDVVLPILH